MLPLFANMYAIYANAVFTSNYARQVVDGGPWQSMI